MERTQHRPASVREKIPAKYYLVFFALFIFVPGISLGFQEGEGDFKSYRGEVVDASSNRALVFATLNVEGTNISTITNTEGNFLLKVPDEITDGKDRKSTRLNSSHVKISYAVFCLKKKKQR